MAKKHANLDYTGDHLEGHETRRPTNSEQQYSKGVTHVFHNR